MTDQDPIAVLRDAAGNVLNAIVDEETPQTPLLRRALDDLHKAIRALDAASQPPATDAEIEAAITELVQAKGNHWSTGEPYEERLDAAKQRIRALFRRPGADAWKPSGIDYDRSIHSNPSAAAWADFFVATFPGLAEHRDTMLGWFANAMMAMHDSRPGADARLRAAAQDVLDARAALTKERGGVIADQHESLEVKGLALMAFEAEQALRHALAASPPEEAAAGQAEPTDMREQLRIAEADFADANEEIAKCREIVSATSEDLHHDLEKLVEERDDLAKKLAAAEEEADSARAERDEFRADAARLQSALDAANESDRIDGYIECLTDRSLASWIKARSEAARRKILRKEASAHPPSSEAREAQIEAWRKLATSDVNSEVGITNDRSDTFIVTRAEIDHAVAIMRSAPAAPPREDSAVAKELVEMRNVIELVASQLRSAWEKRDDAPMSAQSHLQEAAFALFHYAPKGDGLLSTEVTKLRQAVWKEIHDAHQAPPREDALLKLREWVTDSLIWVSKSADDVRDGVLAKIDSLLAKPAAAEPEPPASKISYHCSAPPGQCVATVSVSNEGSKSSCFRCGWEFNVPAKPAVAAQAAGDESLLAFLKGAHTSVTGSGRAIAELCRAELARRSK